MVVVVCAVHVTSVEYHCQRYLWKECIMPKTDYYSRRGVFVHVVSYFAELFNMLPDKH